MILARKFTVATDNDYERLAAASGRLRAVLEAYAENRLPADYSDDVLASYAESILAAQRKDGSVSVSKDPESLAGDVRDDAHRFVTWAAAAFLYLFGQRRESVALRVAGLETGIGRVLRAPLAGDFSFPDSGVAEVVQQVEAVMILACGGIPARLKRFPETAPIMAAALKQLAGDFRRRLDTGDTVLPGGFDYRSLFLQVLEALES